MVNLNIIIQSMDKKTFGMSFIRKCKSEEEQRVKDKFQEYKNLLSQNSGSDICWANIYKNGKFCFQSEEKQSEFKKWVSELILEAENGVPHHIVSYGFINNPSGTKKNQNYHIDYDVCYKNLFIPMTYLVTQNSTQVIPSPIKCEPFPETRQFAKNDKELLQREGVDCLVVSQVIAKPYVILKLEAGTVHRGIKNSTDQDRYMLYIGYASRQFEIEEKQIHTQEDKSVILS